MNKFSEYAKKLLAELKELENLDYDNLEGLKNKTLMLIGKVWDEYSPYFNMYSNIKFGINLGLVSSEREKRWFIMRRDFIHLLETIIDELELSRDDEFSKAGSTFKYSGIQITSKIFIVHGHDNEMKVEVESIIVKLGLEPVILHEQPNKGRTIIEKFTDYSNVGFAVVLLSPDDLGCSVIDYPDKINYRARQNVIMELGFFLGKLKRSKVLPLFRKGSGKDFDLPSDYDGVIYTEYDEGGVWKTKLVRELQEAGYGVDANKII